MKTPLQRLKGPVRSILLDLANREGRRPPRLLAPALARLLNSQLYAPVRSIPPDEIAACERFIRERCAARGFDPDYTRTWILHRYRLYLSVQWLMGLSRDLPSDTTALELGAETLATDILRRYLPGIRWQNMQGDLRGRWEAADCSADLIVCTELIEHLSDLPDGINDTFHHTGLDGLLRECSRVLRPGGCLFITTPNAASLIHVEMTLIGSPPWFFPLHVREYTIEELRAALEAAGLDLVRWQAVHCLTIDNLKDYTPLFRILLEHGYPAGQRGDDLFLVAQKRPAPPGGD